MLIIDTGSRTPPYDQLQRQLTSAITSGELAAGAKLPTVRRLAGDLGVSPNTVARTYRELEREALIETRGRQGSFVARATEPTPGHEEVSAAVTRYVQAMRRLRVDDAAAVRLVQTAFRDIRAPEEELLQ